MKIIFIKIKKNNTDGLYPYCIECNKRKSYQWILDNPEKHKEHMKKEDSKESTKLRTRRWSQIRRENGEYYKWQKSNLEKFRIHNSNRRAYRMLLPNTLTEEEFEELKERFNYSCCLTGSKNYHIEHFIPISWGHGGNYIGNVYLLDQSLNNSKFDKNPFEWFEKEARMKIDIARWNVLIDYLAESNGISTEEFREYVYWCEANKRSINDLESDNTPSLVLWRSKN